MKDSASSGESGVYVLSTKKVARHDLESLIRTEAARCAINESVKRTNGHAALKQQFAHMGTDETIGAEYQNIYHR